MTDVTDREREIVLKMLRLLSEMQLTRFNFESHWEEVAELVLPTSRNTFTLGSRNTQGEKKTQKQVDASGMMALARFAAICDSLLTPRNMIWHQLAASDEYLMKDRAVRLWFEQVNKLLFKYRYTPIANFSSQNNQIFTSLGAFGNGIMFVDALDKNSGSRGLRYKSLPLGEVFIRENHQGIPDSFIRWYRMTARQAKQQWPDTFPEALLAALKSNSEFQYDFLHCVGPREDYEPDRFDNRGFKFYSYHISMQGKCIMQEKGYHSLPIAFTRYDQTPGEVYGRGPAMMVLPSLKTLNAQKRTFLKQGHRASDPVLLMADDGVVGMSLRPGAINKGGISADGKPLVGILPTGSIQINEKMMEMEKAIVDDAFLVNLFQMALNLKDLPQMTATQVIEITNQKGILLAPTVGRQQSEYQGPMVARELDVLSQERLLPLMPPQLREAGGQYEVVYTSPMSKAAKMQETAGFFRTLESVKEIVQITQDPSPLDRFNFDRAVPAIADNQSVPESWMASDEEMAQKRRNRSAAQQRQEQILAAPAQAAMMKAKAAQVKAGMDQQQEPQPQV